MVVWQGGDSHRPVHTIGGQSQPGHGDAAHTDTVRALVWDGADVLVSGSFDKTIMVWNIASAGQLGRLKTLGDGIFESGHGGAVTSLAVASVDGTTVASGSEDGTIKLWDLASGKLLRTVALQHKGVCFLAWVPTQSAENAVSSGWIASGMGDNAIVLSDIASGKHVTTMHGHTGAVHSLLWLNAKGWLVSGSADATVRLWRVR